MSKYYRAALRKYEEDVERSKRSDTSLNIVTNLTVNDPLIIHMMETIAPRIWMSVGFGDEIAQVLDKTEENLFQRERSIHQEAVKKSEEILKAPLAPHNMGQAFRALGYYLTGQIGGLLVGKTLPTPKTKMSLKDILGFSSDYGEKRRQHEIALKRYARPPYPKLWIDVPAVTEVESGIAWSILVEENPTKFLPSLKTGQVRTDETYDEYKQKILAEGWQVKPLYRFIVVYPDSQIQPYIGYIYPGHHPDFFCPVPSLKALQDRHGYEENIANPREYGDFVSHRLKTMFMLMNARNSPFTSAADPELEAVKAGTPEDREAFEKRLVGRNGRQATLRKILKFDLSRLMKKYPKLSREEVLKFVQRHFVRGHFKLRQTGLFWWSPYFRGKHIGDRTDEDLLQRESIVTAKRSPFQPQIGGEQLLKTSKIG